jgi:uncharacterized protein
MSSELMAKKKHLETLIQAWPSAFVAYSGGVDSAFLLWTAHQIHGSKVVGILGDSPSLPRSEHNSALNFAKVHNLNIQILQTHELDDPSYSSNPSNRCFFCRSELFQQMERLAQTRGVAVLAYGENADDAKEVRAGRIAAGQFKVVAPLREAELTKSEIRSLARDANLEISEKPASPCLSSRLAPGLPVTTQRLATIEKAEGIIRNEGFRIVRVRHLGEKALVQVSPDETPRLNDTLLQAKLTPALISIGFHSVEFDAVGYQGAGLR